MARRRDPQLLEAQIEAINRFPEENPNPVLRISSAGDLLYANRAAGPILRAWGADLGARLPEAVVAELRDAAAAEPPGRLEVVESNQTYSILPIRVPELDVINLYGTDVTAARAIERFPAGNPNPVLRMTPDGRLIYANDASSPIVGALAAAVGEVLPDWLTAALAEELARDQPGGVEVSGLAGRFFRIVPVVVPEFGFVNLYGTDVTAERAMNRFPNQNPNPVLRLTRDGRISYANPASVIVRKALGAEVGERLPEATFEAVVRALERSEEPTMEVEADGLIYRLRVVAVDEFASINLYGTDITASRQVERLNAENEALLLNILPRTIADRLRRGEGVIADRFEEMAVLFADVVGFTQLAAAREPDEVVHLLNDVFTRCDQLAEQYGLEKIKTIGDAYMVVGGLHAAHGHPPGTAHLADAAAVADMGLELIAEVGRLGAARGLPLEMRVGLHVGPAVAGVIGLKKFIYDVWGDTVNTASRMESTGLPGRIQVSTETRDRLASTFEFERRGIVDVKGKGRIETWFLVGRLGSASRPTDRSTDQPLGSTARG